MRGPVLIFRSTMPEDAKEATARAVFAIGSRQFDWQLDLLRICIYIYIFLKPNPASLAACGEKI